MFAESRYEFIDEKHHIRLRYSISPTDAHGNNKNVTTTVVVIAPLKPPIRYGIFFSLHPFDQASKITELSAGSFTCEGEAMSALENCAKAFFFGRIRSLADAGPKCRVAEYSLE